ncbi:MAG: GntR family transcriptional regulator [Eubacteriales bacterium]|nr:GntR family transcriptional regulator [Eubacteriales bacterium]
MYKVDIFSNTPIYRQLVDQTRDMIVHGLLRDGDRIPSIRELAQTLGVNASTVAKAYAEMERSGMILTARGRGTFIQVTDTARQDAEAALAHAIDELVRQALFYGLTAEELIALVRRQYEEVAGHAIERE